MIGPTIIQRKRGARISCVLVLTAAGIAQAQTTPAKLEFEAASLKPSGPQSVRNSDGGPGTRDPERFSYSRATLSDLLFKAYGLRLEEQLSGPKWIGAEEYDIIVKIPPGTTKEQFQQMLQNVLTERFRLVIHHDSKVLPVYDLVVAKNGPKLKESTVVAEAPPAGSPGAVGYQIDSDGFPVFPAGTRGFVSSFGRDSHSHWTARQQPISELAFMLNQPNAANRLVIDKTGLTGKYDFTLAYDWRVTSAVSGIADDPGLSLFDALQQQLGLRLVDAKEPFDIVVVDHGEKVPTAN